MLKRKCKECGKRLSESAAACPKCGAPKPLDGWSQVGPAFRFFITVGIAVLCLAGAYALFAVYLQVTGYESYVALKPGMSFSLRNEDVACTSKEALVNLVKYARSGDKTNAERLLTWAVAKDRCLWDNMDHVRFIVDDVIDVDGVGGVVISHTLGDSKTDHTIFYTPRKFVKPWDYLPTTSVNPRLTASDLRKDQHFTINNKDFVACEAKSDLAQLDEYLAKGDKEGAKALFFDKSGYPACFNNDQIFPDEELVLDDVEKAEGIDGDVVAFRRTDFAPGVTLYTRIGFVPPYRSPTPSASN